MARQDGTRRESYDTPQSTYERTYERKGPSFLSGPALLAAVFVALLILALISAYNRSNEQSVTNAPANPPASTQQPDTTPAENPEPDR
jgi:hypothetical protein